MSSIENGISKCQVSKLEYQKVEYRNSSIEMSKFKSRESIKSAMLHTPLMSFFHPQPKCHQHRTVSCDNETSARFVENYKTAICADGTGCKKTVVVQKVLIVYQPRERCANFDGFFIHLIFSYMQQDKNLLWLCPRTLEQAALPEAQRTQVLTL